MGLIDIKGLDKAEVLLALYEASHVQGLGILQKVDSFTIEDAREEIEDCMASYYFDYLHGRVLKVDLAGDFFDDYLFDRDNGEGSAKKAIDKLREKKQCVNG